ncbi:LysE/ArgO family amino acid transporter [Risungbinella massiliensis]|uniref:LysE/ArgO family amino acid transporter n=1 Tax=Risungbinella massiliensis TaxID=1329796 RepID=UPI0005CBD5EF|nr:LysE family transporter [Risungbinella massiliensis]
MEAFITGIILAFGLILPLGVQNVFILNQGFLHSRFVSALPAILTACLCDTILILLAVLGLSLLLLHNVWFELILTIVGVCFLVFIGWTTWRSKPEDLDSKEPKKFTVSKQIMFAASVSLLNPHAILDTIAVIGTTSLHYQEEERILFSSATILVSWIWFFSLAIAGRIMGKSPKKNTFFQMIQKLSALFIWGTALYLSVTMVEKYI